MAHAPRIIHFAGHTDEKGKVYLAEHPVSGPDFAAVCLESERLHTVFANTCYGDMITEGLVADHGLLVVCWVTRVRCLQESVGRSVGRSGWWRWLRMFCCSATDAMCTT